LWRGRKGERVYMWGDKYLSERVSRNCRREVMSGALNLTGLHIAKMEGKA